MNVFASMWGMLGERNEQLGVSRRSQRKEEGEKTTSFSDNIVSFQVHLKLGSLHSDAGSIGNKNRSKEDIFLAYFIFYFSPTS